MASCLSTKTDFARGLEDFFWCHICKLLSLMLLVVCFPYCASAALLKTTPDHEISLANEHRAEDFFLKESLMGNLPLELLLSFTSDSRVYGLILMLKIAN